MNSYHTIPLRPTHSSSEENPYRNKIDKSAFRKETPAEKENQSGELESQSSLEVSDLLSKAISAVDFDPQSLKQSVRDHGKKQSLDKRIAAVAIALVFLILIVDFILQHI